MYAIRSYYGLIKQEAEAIQNIPVTDQYEKSVELIEKHVHQLKGKLVASGMGKAGQIRITSYNVCYTKLLRVRFALPQWQSDEP